MLDQSFCDCLEAKLSEAFANSDNKLMKGFWCDGILLHVFEGELLAKKVNDNRQVSMSAYIGKNGQDKYGLLVKFGPRSLSRYARELNIINCLPNSTEPDWYEIDLTKKELIVFLC